MTDDIKYDDQGNVIASPAQTQFDEQGQPIHVDENGHVTEPGQPQTAFKQPDNKADLIKEGPGPIDPGVSTVRGEYAPLTDAEIVRDVPLQGELRDDRVAEYTGERRLDKGAIIYINGLPFQLADSVTVYGEESNLDVALSKK